MKGNEADYDGANGNFVFIPFVLAALHTSVAYIALQKYLQRRFLSLQLSSSVLFTHSYMLFFTA